MELNETQSSSKLEDIVSFKRKLNNVGNACFSILDVPRKKSFNKVSILKRRKFVIIFTIFIVAMISIILGTVLSLNFTGIGK